MRRAPGATLTVSSEPASAAATGDAADWLRAHARVGRRIAVTTRLDSERGPLALDRRLDVVNGGPRLLRSGRSVVRTGVRLFAFHGGKVRYVAVAARSTLADSAQRRANSSTSAGSVGVWSNELAAYRR